MTLGMVSLLCGIMLTANEPLTVKPIDGQAEQGYIEITGVQAGMFNPRLWEKTPPPLLPDYRRPLLAPRLTGLFRNIYAPSVVKTPEGWRVFYGAWDGVPTGNDRIYCVDTENFLDFGTRRTIIEHGDFIHACNVNAFRNADGSYELMCTVYPDVKKTNKPAYFKSPDGVVWNDRAPQCAAKQSDIVDIQGYSKYPEADINGVNVLFREGQKRHLYFNSYTDFGRVYRATGTDGHTYQFEGAVLESSHAVNDVKKLHVEGKDWYLMGLHMNTNGLWYSLSNDGLKFAPEKELLHSLGDDDRFIVANAWVVDNDKVLGVLYGAGAVSALNRNRIFARWIQKRVVFVSDDGTRCEPVSALGPDRQLVRVPEGMNLQGHFEVFGEDGVTSLAGPIPVTVGSMSVFAIETGK